MNFAVTKVNIKKSYATPNIRLEPNLLRETTASVSKPVPFSILSRVQYIRHQIKSIEASKGS